MALRTPDTERSGTDRRTAIKIIGGALGLSGLAALGSRYKSPDSEYHASGDHGGEAGPAPISMTTRKRLIESRAGLIELRERRAQAYFTDLQKKEEGTIFVPEESADEIDVQCIDGRQRHGKALGIAGLGLLLDGEEHQQLAYNIVGVAEETRERTGRIIPVKLRPHKRGRCGAGKESLKRKGDLLSPENIDEEVMRGAIMLQRAIEHTARQRNISLQVTVEPFPDDYFLDDNTHPEGVALVDAVQGTLVNAAHKKGPLFFNINQIEGKNAAMRDAFVGAILAMKPLHGMHARHDAGLGLPEDFPFTIVLAGQDPDKLHELKGQYEAALSHHEKLASHYKGGRVVVDTWKVDRV